MSDDNFEPIHIEKEILLIVEGIEEKYFFNAFITHFHNENPEEYQNLLKIQILPIGGKTQLADKLGVLKVSPNFSIVTHIGITRDADDNPNSAFQSIQYALRSRDYPVPNHQCTLAQATMGEEGLKKVGIMIIPKDRAGMLETCCFESVNMDKTIPCLNDFFTCLSRLANESDYFLPTNLDKAKVHAFLSTRPDPDLRLGEAANKKYWEFNHQVFRDFIAFLKLLTM